MNRSGEAGRLHGCLLAVGGIGFLIWGVMLWALPDVSASPGEPRQLNHPAVRVLYEVGLDPTAAYIAAASPTVRRELTAATGLPFDFQPIVIPVSKRSHFRLLGGHDAMVAFALPEKKQVVLDLSRFDPQPASLRPVLKHEYAHLLLHHHIPPARLPRWLDEGLAQYFSDGISEYLPGRSSVLGEALAAGRVFPLSALALRFPSDGFGRQLAYEQTRSMVSHMARRYGEDFLPALIGHMANGSTATEAFRSITGIALADFEQEWRHYETSPFSWLGRVAGQLYGVIFFLAAVATLIGYLRYRRRRRAYAAAEEDD